jgi:hypothetical protein
MPTRLKSQKCLQVHRTMFLFVLCCTIVQRSRPWPFGSKRAPRFVWEEDVDDMLIDTTDEVPLETTRREKRDLVWLFGPPKRKVARRKSRTVKPLERQPQPHPLRTEQWELQVNWRNSSSEDSEKTTTSLFVDFAENGYLRATFDKASRQFTMGKWDMTPSGLRCTLNTTMSLHADLHLNIFGKHPRLSRGVIIDTARTGWKNRPLVVGTFTGRGTGHDTADLSYKQRR